MIVTRLVLDSGKIVGKRTLDSDEMDPVLLAQAKRTLSDLRSGKELVVNPVMGGPELEVRLGFGTSYSGYEREIDRLIQTDGALSRSELEVYFQEYWDEERPNSL